MQKKKTQLWSLGIAGYHCRIEYIAGTENTCADLISRKPEVNGSVSETKPLEPDINDITF